LKPLFIGDTVRVRWKISRKKETSKPDRGIVTYTHRVTNQHEATVMEYTVKRMIRRRA
jgi:acyl dehydratase